MFLCDAISYRKFSSNCGWRAKISRVLRRFADLELFNVGMRNRARGTVTETYRQLAGVAVHGAIEKGDGALYHRGHIFGRGRTADGVTTIGLSSLSKVWRLEQTQIPALVRWCQGLAREMENPAPFTTGIPLDHLDAGYDITTMPDAVVLAADWHDEIYQYPPFVRLNDAAGHEHSLSLLDVDVHVDRQQSGADALFLEMHTHGVCTRLTCVLLPYPDVHYVDDAQPHWQIERGFRHVDFADYVTDHPLRFYFADGSLVEGCQLFPAPDPEEMLLYDTATLMEAIDWSAANVDPEREYGPCSAPHRSLHDWLRETLVASDAQVVFYDHRSGECADYLTVSMDAEGEPIIRFYHGKGAGGPVPGDRVDDLYEVCGQATKCVQWRSKKRLIAHVKTRLRTGSCFHKGDLPSFLDLVEPSLRYEFSLEVYAVQPGVSKSQLSPNMALLLATTSRGLVSVGCQRLRVICSP